MKVLRGYYEETLMKEQNDEEKHIEGKKKVKEWLKQKKFESKVMEQEIQKEKTLKEELQREKEVKAQEKYRTWLREKLIQDNQNYQMKKQAKLMRKQSHQQEKERKIELKLKSQQVYQEWLYSKSKTNTSRLGSSRRFKKNRKALKQISSQNESKISKKQITPSSRPPLPRASVHVEEFNSFANPQSKEHNLEDSSMSFLSESYESI